MGCTVKIVNSFKRSSFVNAQRGNAIRLLFALLLLAMIPLFIWAVLTQRIELRKRAATAEPVICWNRVINGEDAIRNGQTPYWPDGCGGMLPDANRMCTQATVPLSATQLYAYKKWITDGKPALPGCGWQPETRRINWSTGYTFLSADAITINANGQIFNVAVDRGQLAPVIHSNPGSGNNVTLEATWQERGIEMRMFIYFLSRCTKSLPPQCSWHVSEIRTYNGNTPGDWIFYNFSSETGTANAFLSAAMGQQYISQGPVTVNATSGGSGYITFQNLRLQGFVNQPTPSCVPMPVRPADAGANYQMAPPPPGRTYCQPGCYYQQVQCIQAPCDPILVCPTTVTSCESARNGALCQRCQPCPEGRVCPLICRNETGTCQNGQCVPQNCVPRPRCIEGTPQNDGRVYCAAMGAPPPGTVYCPVTPTPTPTPANWCPGPNGARCIVTRCMAPAPCPTGQNCTAQPVRCVETGAGTCQNNRCVPYNPTPTPTPTCIPRPACMDPLPGQPVCMVALPVGGRFCPPRTPTPTPSIACKTGINSFSVGRACPTGSNMFTSATYACHDGYRGTISAGEVCQTSQDLAIQAQKICAGRSSCLVTPRPTCTPRPNCIEGTPRQDGRLYCATMGVPPPGTVYCPMTPTPTPACSPIPPGCTDARGNVTCKSLGILPWCPVTPTPRPGTGDINADGKVNIFDYNILLQNFGKIGTPGFTPADIDRNGKVDIFDHKLVVQNLGK